MHGQSNASSANALALALGASYDSGWWVMEIKWHDTDPDTGQRRYLAAERFAGEWRFRWKLQRRGEWTRGLIPTRAMWEHVLDALERRYWRREGVELEDVNEVKQILAEVIRIEELEQGP